MNITIRVIFLLILLILSGFFSGAETALTMCSNIKIMTLEREGDKRAGILMKVLGEHSKMLTCILIGNNLVNISASSISATLAMEIWGSVGVSVATGVLTLVVLIFGEITPKTIASYDPESLALRYALPIRILMIIFTPIIKLIEAISGFVQKLLKTDTSGGARLMTEGELRTYVDVGHEDGAIEADEKKKIHKVFDFSDSTARDIMTPRIDLTLVSETADYDEMMGLFGESKYTRLPVYRDEPENITGVINLKDLVFSKDKESLRAGDISREAFFTYENKKTDDLLEEMRLSFVGMAFILDEYGSCVGMVTMEDLLEELVGDIRDEYDEDEKDLIKKIGPQRYHIAGSVKLDDVGEALDIEILSEDYDSIGGLLIGKLDRIPKRGESVVIEAPEVMPEGKRLEVRAAKVTAKRVERVIVQLA